MNDKFLRIGKIIELALIALVLVVLILKAVWDWS